MKYSDLKVYSEKQKEQLKAHIDEITHLLNRKSELEGKLIQLEADIRTKDQKHLDHQQVLNERIGCLFEVIIMLGRRGGNDLMRDCYGRV